MTFFDRAKLRTRAASAPFSFTDEFFKLGRSGSEPKECYSRYWMHISSTAMLSIIQNPLSRNKRISSSPFLVVDQDDGIHYVVALN